MLRNTSKQFHFRIDDGWSKYMEQSTMLDPSNNVGGPKYDDDEEMWEIST